MKSETRVVVIGGGVVGCSVLFHLTQLGLQDVVLLEQDSLASGTSWMGTGNVHTTHARSDLAVLQSKSIETYRDAERKTGLSCGWRQTGYLTLARTIEDLEHLSAQQEQRSQMEWAGRILTPAQISRLLPQLHTDDLYGGLFDATGGIPAPVKLIAALTKGATAGGAQIHCNTKVVAIQPRANSGWTVTTDAGRIMADHVVNAAGPWAREIAALVGLDLPIHLQGQQHTVIETKHAFTGPTVQIHDLETTSGLRLDGRQIGVRLMYDPSECNGPNIPPMKAGFEALPALDQCIERAHRLAAYWCPTSVPGAVRSVVNGYTFNTPDGAPIVGHLPDQSTFWTACATADGLCHAGGMALGLAQQIVHGQADLDMTSVDIARFADLDTTCQHHNCIDRP